MPPSKTQHTSAFPVIPVTLGLRPASYTCAMQMAVGEEAVLLPTHTPSPRRVGGAIKPTSPARYYGLVAAHKQAAATQEVIAGAR
jgi:hypothetical protein